MIEKQKPKYKDMLKMLIVEIIDRLDSIQIYLEELEDKIQKKIEKSLKVIDDSKKTKILGYASAGLNGLGAILIGIMVWKGYLS